ncbi:hypothetical protein OF829_04390 [Sphingomonas sp. LB-2]|uniref:hypothetical protein n=1 Tax=Sphingomonas caeni TaxID=2984949 RepID=UPI0022322D4C|nr:hypothetical protein [Sphingomonas caeni]MCW3846466.1 hypothetical protein [Sphingomonas caeni]
MRTANLALAAGLLCMLATPTSAEMQSAQQFSNGNFEINRDRVRLGTIGTCAKSTTFLVPTTYLYVTARTKLSAGGGIRGVGAKPRVFVEGPTKRELQNLAAQIQNQVIGALRAEGYTVLTFDDVREDVAAKSRMAPNPRYGMPTHDARAFPGTDFVVATPSDEQTLDYGLTGPAANFGKASQRTGATLLLPEIYLTLPQLGATANTTETETWRSSSASISFDPAMHLAGANVYGATPKGGWCSILVPEHGQRVPATRAGDFRELSVVDDDYGEWGRKRGDYAFVVDDRAFQTGVLATGRTLSRLIADSMKGRR